MSPDEESVLAERLGIYPAEVVASRPGMQFLHALQDDERWTVHPSGYGIIVAHPSRAPVWVRVEDGKVVRTEIVPDAKAG